MFIRRLAGVNYEMYWPQSYLNTMFNCDFSVVYFEVVGPSLSYMSLLHFSKIVFEQSSTVPQPGLHVNTVRFPAYQQPNAVHDEYWYLRDPRWLSSRPMQLGWNPLADLASLFPNLRRLELSLTQLTGPMLLRLCYQTSLASLIFTQVC